MHSAWMVAPLAAAMLLAGCADSSGGRGPNFGGPPPMGPPPAATAVGGMNLRGMAAQYFAAPSQNGSRVQACPGNNAGNPGCAQATADRVCVSAGWRRAAFQLQQTVQGRVLLTDVLCVNN